MGRGHVALGQLMVGMAGSCGGASSGTPVSVVPPDGMAVLAEVTTFERGGLRVLWNGPVHRGPIEAEHALSAGNRRELDDLWDAVGLLGQTPNVDFSKEVVFGLAGPGGVCPAEITHARLDRARILRFSGPPRRGACVDLLTRVATVVAVPRGVLGGEVTIAANAMTGDGFRFRIPAPPAGNEARRTLEREGTPVALGDVALPERGHMALARLANGTEVWVVHHRDGALDVLSPAVATRDTNAFGPRADWEDALFVAPGWSRERGRFWGDYDAHGRNVHGFAPMRRYRFARTSDGRVRVVGPTAPVPPGPILPPEAAPTLDGTESPYTHAGRRTLAEFSTIPTGNTELLAVDVVWGLSGRARLCRAPAATSTGSGFSGCAGSAPVVASSKDTERRAVLVLEGPVLVQRRGPRVADVIVTGSAKMRVVGAPR